MLRRTILVASVVLVLLSVGCGGDDDAGTTDGSATASASNEAQLALSVRVPQYLDDIKSGANPGGRDGATDKLIAVLREHREALGDAVVVKALEDAADYAGQYCAECAEKLAAEAENVSAGSDGY